MDDADIHEQTMGEEKGSLRLAEALQSLPLIEDDPYLRMQALNLGLVSDVLDDMETNLLREYIENDGTISSAIMVSAVSQLWVFGLYEILRTWRQRAFDVLKFGNTAAQL